MRCFQKKLIFCFSGIPGGQLLGYRQPHVTHQTITLFLFSISAIFLLDCATPVSTIFVVGWKLMGISPTYPDCSITKQHHGGGEGCCYTLQHHVNECQYVWIRLFSIHPVGISFSQRFHLVFQVSGYSCASVDLAQVSEPNLRVIAFTLQSGNTLKRYLHVVSSSEGEKAHSTSVSESQNTRLDLSYLPIEPIIYLERPVQKIYR